MGEARALRLRFTADAAAELERVLSEIAQASPQGARRIQGRIQIVLDFLMDQPRSGRLTSLKNLRCIAVRPYPYLIFYEASEDEVVIIGIRHGARAPSSMPGAP
ncbi:type II toxin-antitoxin system RelE/ParE family toxin [Methylobacterium sp. WL7]|nr:type II toxin-antitoxin system RelE/ParE family toxin [Methylobacterium sp. WL7]